MNKINNLQLAIMFAAGQGSIGIERAMAMSDEEIKDYLSESEVKENE